jgi:hypothetical protein
MPGSKRVPVVDATPHRLLRKQVFESARGITRVINLIAVAKNFHKIFTFACATADFQSACQCYGGKWLARRCFSRFFFRVTPGGAIQQQARFIPRCEHANSIFAQRYRLVSGAVKVHQVKVRASRKYYARRAVGPSARPKMRPKKRPKKKPGKAGLKRSRVACDQFTSQASRSDA